MKHSCCRDTKRDEKADNNYRNLSSNRFAKRRISQGGCNLFQMKKYCLILCICFMYLCSFSQNDNWSKTTRKTTLRQTLPDTSIKTEKLTDTGNQSGSQNNLLYDKSGNPVRYRKNQSGLSNTVDVQSTKTNISDTTKQKNNDIGSRRLNRQPRPR